MNTKEARRILKLKKRSGLSLGEQSAIIALARVVEALYPGGDRDHQWSADTLDEIADAVVAYAPPEGS